MMRFRPLTILTGAALAVAGCDGGGDGPPALEVVVYTALDREFSAPILEDYGRAEGVDVLPQFDIESTKSFGLANRIITEAPAPLCDLYWNNEIINTLRLKRLGLLEPFHPEHADAYPAQFRDPDEMWYGFAARARILLVNTNLVPESDRPAGIEDLSDPRWRDNVAIAKPLFGTTGTHAACLFAAWGEDRAKTYFRALKSNGVLVLSGNRQVAAAVGSGSVAIGLTDTDDALGEIAAGGPVAIVYPDSAPSGLGTLFIPNTLARIKGAPHPEQAEALAGYLLSPEVESRLAAGPSGQIPLNPAVTATAQVATPTTTPAMQVDFEAAAALWEGTVAPFLADEFAGGRLEKVAGVVPIPGRPAI